MKTIARLITLICLPIISPFMVDDALRVNGYFRKDGTYVQPHYRSNPDGNPYNNYSFPGNTNPYTGEVASGDAQTYLENYYNSSGTHTTYTLPSYTSTLTPTLTYSTPTPTVAKYKAIIKAPELVEYVGQHDTYAYVYDNYGKNFAQLKAKYSPATYRLLYTDSKE